MKTEISRDSLQLDKRYSGVYQQQGRMLTDADWNEMVDVLKASLSESLKDVVGNGSPLHRNVVDNETDPPRLIWGHVYIDGVHGVIRPDDSATQPVEFEYDHQQDFPSPPVPLPDNCVIYADVWERTVTYLMDERLRDTGLHGADTATRKQILAQVKCCPDDVDPETSTKNPALGNAELNLKLLRKATEADPCDPCADQLNVESAIGNYLFRVEVHDVKGDADDPDEITLKWSSENGAEQFEAQPTREEMPPGFISDKWVYEFFDETSEKHLGVHINGGTWSPSRVDLVEINEPANPYVVPTIPNSSADTTFVRRWDGYCKLNLVTNELVSGTDRGVSLSTEKAADALGYVSIGSSLEIILASIRLQLDLDNRSFVAGDYWLADVREDALDPGDPQKSVLLDGQPPGGIEHHYLQLGVMAGGVLEANPEADRRYAYPALTEMTRLFMAGGDGQEVSPGEPLPQRLRVAVANGEWPVAGATVRFEIEEGGGSLAPDDGGLTGADGIATCEWSPGAGIDDLFRVKATLVDPDDPSADTDHPPVYFCANLVNADQVAYQPDCLESTDNIVHRRLTDDGILDVGPDNYYTVKEALDALLCRLRARHIPYDPTNVDRWEDVNEEEGVDLPETVQEAIDQLLENLHSEDITYPLPDCSPPTNTLRSYLESHIEHRAGDEPDEYRISALWDAVLCHLDAAKLPYDPTDTQDRWEDINEDASAQPQTVQEAIDNIVDNLESSDIEYTPECGAETGPTVRAKLGVPTDAPSKVDDVLDKLLCEFDATHLPIEKDEDLCQALNQPEVGTVQDALNVLCQMRQGGCATPVTPDEDLARIIETFAETNEDEELSLKLMPGLHRVDGFKVLAEHKKKLISIVGCGKDFTTLEFLDELRLIADRVILKNLRIVTVDQGAIFLRGKDVEVDGCEFVRYGGTESSPPFVNILDISSKVGDIVFRISSTLTWTDSDISVNLAKNTYLPSRANAIIAAANDVPARARGAWTNLVGFLSDPRMATGHDNLEARRELAREILDVPITHRRAIFRSRPVENIEELPDQPVVMRARGMTSGPFAEREAIRLSADSSPVSATDHYRSVRAIADDYYEMISSATLSEINVIALGDLIRDLAEDLYSAPGAALAISSSAVNGAIRRSTIHGTCALFSDQPNPLTPLADGTIKRIQKGLDFIGGSGTLTLEGNYLSEIVSHIRSGAFHSGRRLANKLSGYFRLNLINNTIVTGASFVAVTVTMTGNRMAERGASSPDPQVAALVVCSDGTFTANSAQNPASRVERVFRNRVQSANLVNFLDLYDPEGSGGHRLDNGEDTPAGTIAAYANERVPEGWTECDGRQLVRSDYPVLFDTIGTRFGVGNGSTTFNIPDLRGEFIRGWPHGSTRDPEPNRPIGDRQNDRLRSHRHIYQRSLRLQDVYTNPPPLGLRISSNISTTTSTVGLPTVPAGSETRPKNVAMLYCIKY